MEVNLHIPYLHLYSVSSGGEPGVVAETTDHKPSLDSERERVERLGLELQTTIHEDGAMAATAAMRKMLGELGCGG